MNNSFLIAVSKYGIGSVIGLYLTYLMAQNVPILLDKVSKAEATHITILENQVTLKETMANITFGIRQICLNGAKTNQAISNCNRVELP